MVTDHLPMVDRHLHIAEQVVFVDGLTGTGKTMVGPILSSLQRVEVQRFDHIHEYICALNFLKRMELDAAESMIRTYVDLACYNLMISRESNFRWKDLSGVLSNPGGLKYLKRLFAQDGNPVIDRINQERPIVQLASHQTLGISEPLFSALGPRLTVVETVRHPLHLLEHWYSYIDRHGTDPREFTIWLNHKGTRVPWFAFEWEDIYIESNKMDKVILSIDWLVRLADSTFKGLTDCEKSRVVTIPFEKFVSEPGPYMRRLCEVLDTNETYATKRAMRKQKVPRKLTASGIDRDIYRRYSWKPPSNLSTESDELNKKWEFANREASNKGMAVLDKLCKEYQTKYLSEG